MNFFKVGFRIMLSFPLNFNPLKPKRIVRIFVEPSGKYDTLDVKGSGLLMAEVSNVLHTETFKIHFHQNTTCFVLKHLLYVVLPPK